MQQLKRSYSLTDLGEQQFDQHRFTDVTEEEEGERFLFIVLTSSSSSFLFSTLYPSFSCVSSSFIWLLQIPKRWLLLPRYEEEAAERPTAPKPPPHVSFNLDPLYADECLKNNNNKNNEKTGLVLLTASCPTRA